MEFFYDEQAVANEDALVKGNDGKTEEAFNKLEDELSKQYEKTTSALKNLVEESEDGVKINLPLNSEVSETAQRYLQHFDSNLQSVETLAQNYWTKVANPGFWSTMTGTLGKKLEEVVQISGSPEMKLEDSNKAAQAAVAGNRTDAELRELSINKGIYLEHTMNLDASFDVDAKTDEIARLLEQDKDLAKLMNGIVPQVITYKDFWNVYFLQKERILDMENKRKRILENNVAEGEEEVGWDDDVEEGEVDEDESVIVINEDSTIENRDNLNSKTEEVAAKMETTGENDGNEDDVDDDDDDDWE